MWSPDWNVSVVDIHLRKLLWMYCPGHAGVKGNDRADRLAGKATKTSGLLLGRSEVLKSLWLYLREQSQCHYTIDRLEERGVERGSARRSSLNGQEKAIISPTNIENVSKATVGHFWETRWSAYGLFRAHRYRVELNWTVSSFAPNSEALLPSRSSRYPNPYIFKDTFRIAALPPEEGHRKRHQIAGRLHSEGDTALLPSHFGGVQWYLFWFNICRLPQNMSPTDDNFR